MAFAGVSDGLSLDLQFAADKSLTARKGQTLVFTRASTATYYGPLINAVYTFEGYNYNLDLYQTGLYAGRYRWEGGDTGLTYTGTAWSLFHDGNNVATSAPTSDSWRPDQADWSVTGAVITPTRTFGIVRSASGEPRFDHNTTAPNACRGLLIEEGRTNLVLQSATLATQTRTVTATAHTLSFYGTGTVVLSGARVATVTGTGAFPTRTTFTFTPTSGSLTLTVTGTVQFAQLEAGAFASSYIPTTTGPLFRSADLCSITGEDFTSFYNEFAGTVLCESILNGVTLSFNPITAIFGGQQNGIYMIEYTGTPSLFGLITTDETTYFNSNIGNTPSGAARKSAMAFQNDGSAILCLNGTLGTQDNSVFLPNSLTSGQTPSSLSLFMSQFSTVKSFRYYKKRLANAKLQSLTQFASDPDANAYIVSLLAAGATLDTPQQNAINTFVSGEKTAGRWGGIKRLYFPVWGLAAANAICMKSLATGTWTGGAVTHAAGYVQSTRTGGYMNTNTNFPALGITKDSYHFAVVYKTFPYGGDNYTDASFGSSDNTYFGVEDGNVFAILGGAYLSANYAPLRVFSLGGNASSQYLKNRNSGEVTNLLPQSQVISNAFGDSDVYFLRYNGYDRSSVSQTGLLSLGTTLTTEQDTAYTLNLQNLYNRIRFNQITGLDWQNYADETIAYVVELNNTGLAYI